MIHKTLIISSISDDDIKINGYNILRRDLPTNQTHGGVMLYFKETMALKECVELENHPNFLVTEITFGRKKVFFTLIYRKFGQTFEEFENFSNKFTELCNAIKLKKPYMSIFVGDFNAHSSTWWSGDKNDYFGTHLDQVFDSEGLHQLVNKPTYLVGNSASCIDLVLTNQPNLFIECEIHPSLHSTCHHQINFSKVNNDNPPPKPYKRRL